VVDPGPIIEELNKAGVDYVIIGGIAATLHGCPEQTFDLDIIYAPTLENRARLLQALKSIGAEWDEPLTDALLQRQFVFSLNSKYGDLDVFTRIAGLNDYNLATAAAEVVTLEGRSVKVLNLSSLIATKEAAADPNPRKMAALDFLKELKRRGGQILNHKD
jgi:hypothetical protein